MVIKLDHAFFTISIYTWMWPKQTQEFDTDNKFCLNDIFFEQTKVLCLSNQNGVEILIG